MLKIMIPIYTSLIIKGAMNFSDTPKAIKPEVKAALIAAGRGYLAE